MLHKPTKGEILIDGEDITKYNEKQLQELRRTKVSMVFQNGGLLSIAMYWVTWPMAWKYAVSAKKNVKIRLWK
mgnify:FL=1